MPPSQLQSKLNLSSISSIVHGFKAIDTSRNYPAGGTPGTSDALLGSVKAASQGFIIDSKIDNRAPADHESEDILTSVDQELAEFKTDRARIDYLHWPGRTVPLQKPLCAINEKSKQGKFDKLGISNHAAAEVEQIIEIREKEGRVQPTVYQGQYNALCQRGEKELFPTLKETWLFIFCLGSWRMWDY